MRIASLLLLVCGLNVQAQTSVLFIGNSYVTANDLPNTFQQLALSLGDEVTVASSAPGGYTFYQHSTHAPTLNAITSQPWDFVVMQEQSQLGALPSDVTTTEYGAIELLNAIETNWECTYPVLYMTWGRENGDAQNCASFPFMCTYEGMQLALRTNYVALGNFNDAWVAPVGAAWATVRAQHPEIDLYVDDGSHPTAAGTYLAACVFYSTFFHASCVDATFTNGLPTETAASLRSIASATVLDAFETWNLDMPNGTDALLDGFEVGPDFVTLMHDGAGEHLWTCTNGQSFTTATVTFTFETAGSYIVTHTYNDPCGNSDTRNFTFDMAVGLDELGARPQYNVMSNSPGLVEVHGAEAGGTLTVFDAQGRMLVNERIGGANVQIACPAGLLFWRVSGEKGTTVSGKVVVW